MLKRIVVALALILAATPPVDAGITRWRWIQAQGPFPSVRIPQFIVADTVAELPSDAVAEGDVAYTKDTDELYTRTATAWAVVAGGGGGAPTTATYLTQTPDATLSAEQAMSLLGTGITINTTGTGAQSIYAGTSCTNQFPRSLDASGAATCASVADADLASSYSGIGACAANQWASTLNDNAAPTCTQPAFSNLSGAATDAQVPNNVTIDLAAAATALAANPADCATSTHFAVGVTADGTATCEAIADADVPNNITIDLATAASIFDHDPSDCPVDEVSQGIREDGVPTCTTITDSMVPNTITLDNLTQITTRAIADTTGTLAVSRGGTNLTAAADDNVMLGNGTTWESKAIPDCGEAGTLNYTAATNTFTCLSDSGGGGGLTLSTVEKDLGTTAQFSGSFDITGLSGLTAGRPVLVAQAAGPYTGKGDRQDEAEMDLVTATGYVVNTTTIRVYWTAQPHTGPLIGNVVFNYVVG